MKHTLFGIVAILALLLTAAGCSSGNANRGGRGGRGDGTAAAAEQKAVPVQMIPVEARELRRTVESVGTLFPYEEVVVSSEVDGRADKVLVDVGDYVRKGQTLVEIVPVEFKLAADQQAALLDEVRAKLGLNDPDSDITDPMEAAAVRKAAADLANAGRKFNRTKELTEQGLLPKQTYDQDEAAYKAAQANYEIAVQEVRNLQAAIREQHAKTELARKKLRDTTIAAPFSGYVKERTVTVGQYVRVQTPVITIVNSDPMRVRVKIPEKMAAWIPVGQQVNVQVEAYPDRTFTGKVWRVSPSVDPQTRTFDAEALVENREGLLKPGFFARAQIASNKVEEALFIPQKALNYSYGIYKVFVVNGSTVQGQEVKLGDRVGEDVEIVSGITAGGRIALPASEQELRDGVTVQQASLSDSQNHNPRNRKP